MASLYTDHCTTAFPTSDLAPSPVHLLTYTRSSMTTLQPMNMLTHYLLFLTSATLHVNTWGGVAIVSVASLVIGIRWLCSISDYAYAHGWE